MAYIVEVYDDEKDTIVSILPTVYPDKETAYKGAKASGYYGPVGETPYLLKLTQVDVAMDIIDAADRELFKNLKRRATPSAVHIETDSREFYYPESATAGKEYQCPDCGAAFPPLGWDWDINDVSFCPNCGQALDWSNY